ncbi:MAG: ATP-binding protein, partial [Bryobacteraceae bacterium]
MVEQLIGALERLDAMLEIAVKQAAGDSYDVSADLYRGLQIRPADVERLLGKQPCVPCFNVGDPAVLGKDVPRLAWLGQTFGLTSFDSNAILIALAPEIDLRYERLYAYLQDDVTRRRPTVDLALNLFSDSPETKLALRTRFSADAPLVRHKLIQLIPDPAQVQPPLLSHYLKLEDQLVGFILGENSLDHRLSAFCRFEEPARLAEESDPGRDTIRALPVLAMQMRDAGRPVTLYFQGAGVSAKIRAAQMIAQAAGARLLMADLAQAPEAPAAFQETVDLVFRQATLQNTVLYIDGLDTLRRDSRPGAHQVLSERLAKFSGIAIVSGARPWIPAVGGPMGVRTVRFGVLDRPQALSCWQDHMERAGAAYDPDDLLLLADRFRLTPDQIADAVACARNEALWQAAASDADTATAPCALIGNSRTTERGESIAPCAITLDQLCAAARAECGHELTGLARKIRPKYTWVDIVLPPDQLDQLQEVRQQATHWQTVFAQWGFDHKQSLGKGLNVLFSGPPGTGKTMAAEVLASD